MYSVELYSRVRRACHVDGMSKSAGFTNYRTVISVIRGQPFH